MLDKIYDENCKSKHQRGILHIGITLGIAFQPKQTILDVYTNLPKKDTV